MIINGIGIISPFGRGKNSLQHILNSSNSNKIIKDELLKEKSLARKIRRADRFSKMSLLAAKDAFQDAKLPLQQNCEQIGIILTTQFGPHISTFSFLDNIIDYNEKEVSPTKFTHSVHNSAVSYISTILNIKGPSITVTKFTTPFLSALLIAKIWLQQKKCKHILIGYSEEYGSIMDKIHNKNQPINHHLTEGSIFFLVSNDDKTLNTYCKIDQITIPNHSKTCNITCNNQQYQQIIQQKQTAINNNLHNISQNKNALAIAIVADTLKQNKNQLTTMNIT